MLIFGTGQFAEIAHFYFTRSGRRVTAFTGDELGASFQGLPILPWCVCKPDELYIAVGYSKLNQNREMKVQEARARGFKLVPYLSEAAFNLGTLGEHTFIFENNVIQPFVTIGDNSVLWSGNHIGHHSKIGNNCFITSHVVVSGGCEIGDNTFIGVNSCLADGIKVGHHAIITMGSKVTKDVPDYGVWHGESLSKVPSTKVKL